MARRKKSKKLLSSDWAENLVESNKGLLLRPGAMVEGVERAGQAPNMTRQFPHDHLQPREESVTCRFCQGRVQVVENLRTCNWFHLDVPVAERNLYVTLN